MFSLKISRCAFALYKVQTYARNVGFACHTDGKVAAYTTTHYDYDQVWLNVEEQHVLKFSARACRDVNVGLFETFGNSSSAMYRVMIGGWNNEASAIRSTPVAGASDLVKIDRKAILSCNSLRPFWISWEDGLIQVGYGWIIGVGTLMQWQVRGKALTVAGASLVSGYPGTDVSAEWEIYSEYDVAYNIANSICVFLRDSNISYLQAKGRPTRLLFNNCFLVLEPCETKTI